MSHLNLLRRFVSPLFFLAVGGVAACSSEVPPAPRDDVEVGDDDVVAGFPQGTFTQEQTVGEPPHDRFRLTFRMDLTLKQDKTYRLVSTTTCEPPCSAGWPATEETGRYVRSTRNGVRFVRFVADGQPYSQLSLEDVERFEWRTTENGFEIRIPGDSESYKTFSRSNQAWCAAPTDCALQGLALPRCVGAHFVCTANACASSGCGR